MPIRLNLLAEAQALEDLRRRDPVKRAVLAAAVIMVVLLSWSATLQLKILASGADLRSIGARWKTIEGDFKSAVDYQRELMETERKLAALEQYRTNRFLWGSALNAFQQTLVGLDQVQVVRLKGDQVYQVTDATPARTNGTAVIPGKPATSLEKIHISLEATDSSSPPGSLVSRLKTSILAIPYFDKNLQTTNGVLLTSLSPPQVHPDTGSAFVKFTLQCLFPEKVR